MTPANQVRLARLRVSWAGIALAGVLIVAGAAWLLWGHWSPRYATRWLIVAALLLARLLWLLWHGLPRNHRAGEEDLLPTLGWGNGLTVARGLLIALLAGFIFAPWPLGWLGWMPALLYMTGAIMDHLDGYVARVTNHATALGEMLDMEYDVLGILAAVVLAIHYGQLPLWYLAVGLARELFLFGHWVLRKRGRPVYDLPPSTDRRLIAGLQMGFLGVVLWPVLAPPATTVGAVLFALPMVVSFGRDWMVTSGAWDVNSAAYRRRRRVAKLLLEEWLPVVARVVGTIVGSAILWRELPTFPNWGQIVATPALLWALVVVIGAALLLFASGLLGRMAGLVLVGVACFDIYSAGFLPAGNGLLLVGASYVLIFGSGTWSLWSPEERALRHRAGDPRTDTA